MECELVRRLLYALLALFSSENGFSQTYTISTFAGGGVQTNIAASVASLYEPQGVAVDQSGNVFFTEYVNSVVYRLDIKTGLLTLVAGNGTSGFSGDNGPTTSAQLSGIYCCGPSSLAIDSAGSLYIADSGNNRIRKVSNGVITTVAGGGTSLGDNGPATSAQLVTPEGVAIDSVGNLYIADTRQYRIRKVSNGIISTVAGDGVQGIGGENVAAVSAHLNLPQGVAIDGAGSLYIADTGQPGPGRIRKVSNGMIATIAGGGAGLGSSGPATNIRLSFLSGGIAVDSGGNVYFTQYGFGFDGVYRISNGVLSAFTEGFNYPEGVASDSVGNVYVADSRDSVVKKIVGGVVITVAGNSTPGFAGDNGPASKAELYYPQDITIDANGNLYFTDFFNHRVRKVSNGIITTVAGGGAAFGDNGPATSAQLSHPYGVTTDSVGNLYIADANNSIIRKVTN